MRKFISVISVIAFALAIGITALADKPKKGAIKFETTSHNFGIIKEDGGPVSCEFPFVNDGEGNLVILEAKAECGCTRPEFPKAPVVSGKGGVIKVTYNPLGRPGGFTKVVTVKTNGNPSKIRLKIRGTVNPKKQDS